MAAGVVIDFLELVSESPCPGRMVVVGDDADVLEFKVERKSAAVFRLDKIDVGRELEGCPVGVANDENRSEERGLVTLLGVADNVELVEARSVNNVQPILRFHLHLSS